MNEIEQKEIEEMADIIFNSRYKNDYISPLKGANELYKQGYRQVKDKVVLDKEEYKIIDHNIKNLETICDNLEKERNNLEGKIKLVKQQTAREIMAELVGHTLVDDGWTWTISQKDIQWLADKYGVEVE